MLVIRCLDCHFLPRHLNVWGGQIEKQCNGDEKIHLPLQKISPSQHYLTWKIQARILPDYPLAK